MIWRRLRFWLVMFLLIAVAFGLLVFHVHRKSLGPPTLHGRWGMAEAPRTQRWKGRE
jgi:hypothetical protein